MVEVNTYSKGNVRQLEPNAKGRIAEEIAQSITPNCLRCKTNDLKYLEDLKFSLEHKKFIAANWKYWDLIKVDTIPEIIEVKCRNYFVTNKKWQRHAINPFMMQLFKEAKRIGIKVTVLEIVLSTNWNYFFRYKEFNQNLFSISKSRGVKARIVAGHEK